MIFDTKKVAKAIVNKLSLNQRTTEDLPELSPLIANDESFYNVSQVHPLINLENIDSTISYFDSRNYPTYSAVDPYTKADVVESDTGEHYQALANHPAGTDLSDTSLWFPMDEFNLHIHSVLYAGALRAVNTVMNGKKIRQSTKEVFGNIPLFDGSAHKSDIQPNQNNFVGYRFVPNESHGLVTYSTKISFQFNKPTTFNLFLYHTSSTAPLEVILVEYTKVGGVQWMDIDFRFDYLNSETGVAGGEYFLGYAQSEVEADGANALHMRDLNWSTGHEGCYGCGNRSRIHYQNYSPYISVQSMAIPESKFTVGGEIFDYRDVSSGTCESYGMNMWLTTKCDLTDGILHDIDTYCEAAMNVAGLEFLKGMDSTTRDENELANSISTQAAKQVVLFDYVTGTVADVTKSSLEALSYDLSSIDKACLKCDDRVEHPIMRVITLS